MCNQEDIPIMQPSEQAGISQIVITDEMVRAGEETGMSGREGFAETNREVFDLGENLYKFRHDGGAFEFTAAECYLKGWLDLWFLTNDGRAFVCSHHVPMVAGQFGLKDDVTIPDKLDNSLAKDLHGGLKRPHLLGGKRERPPSGGNELMLVIDVKRMQPPEQWVAASIRTLRFDYSDDIFTGKVCLSILHGGLKSVLPLPERELHGLGLIRRAANHGEHSNVQGAPHVVDGVPDYECQVIRDGLIGFDAVGSLSGVALFHSDEFERVLSQEGVDPLVQIVDVILGPLELKGCWLM